MIQQWIRDKSQRGYKRLISTRRRLAIVSIVMLGGGLLACDPTVSSAPLITGEMVGVRGYPENASRASANVFKFQCENVQQVSVQVIRVRTGEAETISDTQYQRPQGAMSPNCLAAVSFKQAVEEVAQATFVFTDHLTAASGEAIPAVSSSSRPGFGGSRNGASSSHLPEGHVIESAKPEILYWQMEYPSQAGIFAAAFSSISEMKSFTQSNLEMKVWAVIIQPTE